MKKWLKRLLAVALIFVLFVGAAFLYLTSDGGIRNVILPRVSEAAGVRVAAGSVKLSVTSGIEIHDLEVGPADAPLLKAGKTLVAWPIGQLLKGRIALDQVLLSDAQIEVRQRPDGTLTLPALPGGAGNGDAGPATGGGAIPELDIRDVQLRNVTLTFVREGADPMTAVVKIPSLHIPEIRNGAELKLDLESAIQVSMGDRKLAIEALTLSLASALGQDLMPTTATLDIGGMLGITAPDTKIENRQIRLQLASTLNGDAVTLQSLTFRQLHGDQVEGAITASGNWNTASASGEASVDAKLPAGGLQTVAAKMFDWDLGRTALTYTGKIAISPDGIGATGEAAVTALTVSSASRAIPAAAPLDLTLKHVVRTAGKAIMIDDFALVANHEGRPVITANLAAPMSLDPEKPESASGKLTLAVDRFPLSVLSPFMPADGPRLTGGVASATLDITAGGGGDALSVRGGCELSDLQVIDKDLNIPAATIRVKLDALVDKLDQIRLSNLTTTIAGRGGEILKVVVAATYSLKGGNGEITISQLESTPNRLFQSGIVLPGLAADSCDLRDLSIQTDGPLVITVSDKNNVVEVAGKLTAGPLRGRYDKLTFNPERPLTLAADLAAALNMSAGAAVVSRSTILINQEGAGRIEFALRSPIQAILKDKPALAAPAAWKLTVTDLDPLLAVPFIPKDTIVLNGGRIGVDLSGTANWPALAATATGTVTTRKLSATVVGQEKLPAISLDTDVALDVDWSATAPTTVRKLTATLHDPANGTLSLSLTKPFAIDLAAEKPAQATIAFEVSGSLPNLAQFAGLMPKDAPAIQSGAVKLTASGTAGYPDLKASAVATVEVSALKLKATAPGQEKVPVLMLDANVALDADWSATAASTIRKLTADLREAEAGALSFKVSSPFSIDLASEKPPQATIPFEVSGSFPNLAQFAALMPPDAPVIQSGALKVTARGSAGYPALQAAAKATVAIDGLKLKAPGADAPEIPKLAIAADLEADWRDGDSLKLDTLVASIKDLDGKGLLVDAHLTRPGILNLKEGAPQGAPVALEFAVAATDLLQIVPLLPKDLPVTIGGGAVKITGAAEIGMPKLTASANTTVDFSGVLLRPTGANAFLPALTGLVKVDAAFADEWLDLKGAEVAVRDPQGSLVALTAAGRIDSTLLRPGSRITVRATDTIDVDRLLALLPASAAPETKPAAPTTGPRPTAPAPAPEPMKLNIAADLDLAKIKYQQLMVENLKGSVAMVDGKVTVSPMTLNLNGAPVQMTAVADLGAAKGLPFEVELQASELQLKPVFATFAPAAGAFADGRLAKLHLKASGPDIAWENLQKTLKASFDGSIDELRLSATGKPLTDLAVEIALFKCFGLSWNDLAFGSGSFSGIAGEGQLANIMADLRSPQLRLVTTGSVSLTTYDPNLLVDAYGRGTLASHSFIGATPDADGYAKLNDTISIPSWEKSKISFANAKQIAQAAGLSGQNAAIAGGVGQLLNAFGGKKKDEEPKDGEKPAPKKSGFGAALGGLIQAGVGQLATPPGQPAPTPAPQPPAPAPVQDPQTPAPPPKKSGLDDFLK